MQISNFTEVVEQVRKLVRQHLAAQFASQGRVVSQPELDRLVSDICISIAAGSVAALNSAPLVQDEYRGYQEISIDPNSTAAAALFGKVPQTVGTTQLNGRFAEAAPNHITVEKPADIFKWS